MIMDASPPRAVKTVADLRTVYQPPLPNVLAKAMRGIDQHTRRFIALSPFVCIGTSGPDGLGDVSPRGGEPGFVQVLDEHHLALPDHRGNNRIDSLSNLVAYPGIGLLFMVPGFEDTLRVNGTACISFDADLVARFMVEGKPPRSVVVIEVREAYMHCGKAIRRARLWDPAAQVDRRTLPSTGQIYRDQLKLEKSAAAIDQFLEDDAKQLY
jgi:uncharacterized protein